MMNGSDTLGDTKVDSEKWSSILARLKVFEEEWLPSICPHSQVKKYVRDVEGEGDEKGVIHTVRLYTEDTSYQVTALVERNGHTYLGAVSSCRKPRAGEEHLRGHDLPDGPIERKTWDSIVAAIVKDQLVPLQLKMPSNEVRINGQEALSWEVPDSKMEAVISVLDAVGGRAGFDEQQQALRQSREDHDRALFGVDEVGVEIDEGGNVVPSSTSICEAKKKKGGVNEAPTTPPPPPPKGQGGTTGT